MSDETHPGPEESFTEPRRQSRAPSSTTVLSGRCRKESCVSRHIDFSGVWIPLVTPFREGRVDHAALAALVRRLAADGVAGFVVCATTGEAPLLSHDERVDVLGTIKAAPARPLIMGASATTADEALR